MKRIHCVASAAVLAAALAACNNNSGPKAPSIDDLPPLFAFNLCKEVEDCLDKLQLKFAFGDDGCTARVQAQVEDSDFSTQGRSRCRPRALRREQGRRVREVARRSRLQVPNRTRSRARPARKCFRARSSSAASAAWTPNAKASRSARWTTSVRANAASCSRPATPATRTTSARTDCSARTPRRRAWHRLPSVTRAAAASPASARWDQACVGEDEANGVSGMCQKRSELFSGKAGDKCDVVDPFDLCDVGCRAWRTSAATACRSRSGARSRWRSGGDCRLAFPAVPSGRILRRRQRLRHDRRHVSAARESRRGLHQGLR